MALAVIMGAGCFGGFALNASASELSAAEEEHTHSYTCTIIKEPECTSDGEAVYICSCGDSYSEILPAAHSYEVDSVIEPSFESGGYTVYVCTVCGDSFEGDQTDRLAYMSDVTITGLKSVYDHTGGEILPELTLSFGEKTLAEGKDYTVSCSSNKNVGTAYLTVTGEGSYVGSVEKTFDIKYNIADCKVSGIKSSYSYTGKAIKPSVTVKSGSKTLPSSCYTVSYKSNKAVGKATVTIKAKGDKAKGTYKKTFVIKPKKNKIKSIYSPKTDQIRVTYNKDTSVTGYQILYSTDKAFEKNVYSKTVTNPSTVTKTVVSDNIKKGKKYYVKVRSFVKIDGERYGDYSDAVTVTQPKKNFGLVEKSKKADKSYFDDTAFVGDSISLKLSYYQSATKSLGKAKFFAAGSLSAGNSLWAVSSRSVHPLYNGRKTLVEDCIKSSGVKKVYIMLGMNDLGAYGIDGSLDNYKTLISRIKKKSPNVQIFIQSVTPIASSSTVLGKRLNNDIIAKYNKKLLKACEENGWYFVDVGEAMYDDSGKWLKREYCSDYGGMGIHFTDSGCKKWVEYLLTHTV